MEIGAFIVDDQQDIRLLIRLIIDAADEGIFVSGEASGGSEALARLDELDPTIVVLDQMMPGMTGIETAQAIRERRPGQLMIMCSAYLDDALRRSAEEVGIKLCVSKSDIATVPQALRAVATAG